MANGPTLASMNLIDVSRELAIEAMKVDRKQFGTVVGNLLKTPPVRRAEAKTGQPKMGKIIPPAKA